jgi:hypothetical protein
MGVIESFYEPLTTLAFLAGATSRIRLGVSAYVVKPLGFQPFVDAIKGLALLRALINEPAAAARHLSQ